MDSITTSLIYDNSTASHVLLSLSLSDARCLRQIASNFIGKGMLSIAHFGLRSSFHAHICKAVIFLNNGLLVLLNLLQQY